MPLRSRSSILLVGALAVLAACGEARARIDALLTRDGVLAGLHSLPPDPGDTASLFGSYRPTSPHWAHIRTMVTDFRTTYVKPPHRAQEIAWGARHFDWVMSGDGAAYKSTNPTLTYLPYALEWDPKIPGQERRPRVATDFVPDMQDWFARHPQYSLEGAFLHRAGVPPSLASRVEFRLWGARRWVINPGDPGARAYQAHRIRRVVGNADGVFLDEHSSADLVDRIHTIPILEYPNLAAYDTAEIEMLRLIRAAIAPKIILLNTSEYMRPFDREMILAAGGAQLERMNNPFSQGMVERWGWMDELLAHGVTVELVSLNTWAEENRTDGVFRGVTPGDYGSKAERMKLWELASYYMVVPAVPDRLLLDLNPGWNVSSASVWLRAQEADIGHPHAPRAVAQRGTDPTGAKYQIWGRDFDRALVLVRPVGGWRDQRYGDSTAVSVQLSGNAGWRLLRGDGTLGPRIVTLRLRNMEAAILIREPLRAATGPAPPEDPAAAPCCARARRSAATAPAVGPARAAG